MPTLYSASFCLGDDISLFLSTIRGKGGEGSGINECFKEERIRADYKLHILTGHVDLGQDSFLLDINCTGMTGQVQASRFRPFDQQLKV